MKLSVCLFSAYGATEIASTDGFTRLPNMECLGAYKFISEGLDTIDDCEAKCAADNECNAYHWAHLVQHNQDPFCTLFKNCFDMKVSYAGNEGSVSAYKNTHYPFSTVNAPGVYYEHIEHKVCNGNDLGAAPELNISLAECSALCSKMVGCKGVSYNPDFSANNNNCFFKSSMDECDGEDGDLDFEYKTVSLVPKDWTENYTLLHGQKCNDAVFHTEVVANFDDCLTKCAEFERCRTVTFQPGEEQSLCLYQDSAESCEEAEGGFEAAIKNKVTATTPYERAQKIQNDIMINIWKGGISPEKTFYTNVKLRIDWIMYNANDKYYWFKTVKDCPFPEHWDWNNYQQWLEEQNGDRYNREDPCKAINQLFLGLERWMTIYTKNCSKTKEKQQYAFKNRQMKKLNSTRNRIFEKMQCTHFINKYNL